jgi:bla regulator protein blaR1
MMTWRWARKQGCKRDLAVAALGAAVLAAALAFSILNASQVRGQSPPATEPPLAFEVATIKENHDVQNRVGIRFAPGRFTATGVPLKMLITFAYNVRQFQISGGPNWINTEKYDIDAKEPDGLEDQLKNLPDNERREKMDQLIRSLLTDRFQLKVSHETKEGPVYNLVVAKNGPLIHEAKPDDNNPNAMKGPDGKPVHGNFMRMGRGELQGQGVAIEFLATNLSQQLGRKVVDQTGLKGNYDFTLKWTPDQGPGGPGGMMEAGPGGPPPGAGPGGDAPPPPDASGPSIFTAIQEQLGLKLESAKGPVEMLVIVSIEKPSEN